MSAIAQAVQLMNRVFAEHGGGGNLHIAIDDGNLDDENIQWCIEHAGDKLTANERACAELLLTMTEDERQAAYERAGHDADVHALMVKQDPPCEEPLITVTYRWGY